MSLSPKGRRRKVSTQERPLALPLSENEIQRAVFDNLRQRPARGVFAFHPKNGGIHQRGRRRGINSGLGVVSGVPDVIVMRRGEALALELKTEKGKVTDEQFGTMKAMAAAGYQVDVAFGLNDALAKLEAFGALEGYAT